MHIEIKCQGRFLFMNTLTKMEKIIIILRLLKEILIGSVEVLHFMHIQKNKLLI